MERKTRRRTVSKALLRKDLHRILECIRPNARRLKSDKITGRVLVSREYRGAKKMVVYAALEAEVQTKSLIQKALAFGKEVYLPKVVRRTHRLQLYRVCSIRKDLKKGAYGILEPRIQRARLGRPSDMELILVPGLGFTRKGLRLGRGGGYFDRLLKKTIHAKKVGLAYREQIMKRLPMGKYDQKVDRVVTDS